MTTYNRSHVYTRGGVPVRLTVTHLTDAGHHTEAQQRAHQRVVEGWTPESRGYPGTWEMVRSGGAGGGVDSRGREATYVAEWVRID